MRLFEVKYYQPQSYRSSAQYRYANCYLETPSTKYPDAVRLRLVGGEGVFPFENGVCEKFLGEYSAEIVGEISINREMEADRIEEIAPDDDRAKADQPH